MARRLRFYEATGVYFVTIGTHNNHPLIRPEPAIAEVLGGVLARACILFPTVKLFGFVALSTHLHLLCRAEGSSLSAFMRYVLTQSSIKLSALIAWDDAFWDGPFSAEPVLDAGAIEERLEYILSHGVKEGLVDTPGDWPGLSCLPQLLGPPTRSFRFYAWQRRWSSGRRRPAIVDRFSSEIAEEIELTLEPLPHWSDLPEPQRRARVEAIINRITTAHQGKPKAGIEAVLSRPLEERIVRKTKRRKPWCHASTVEAWEDMRARYCAFAAAFKEASRRYRAGELDAKFPPYSFRPYLAVAPVTPTAIAA